PISRKSAARRMRGRSGSIRCRLLRHGDCRYPCSPAIFVALQDSEAEPAPVDAVTLDEALIIEVHRLDEIHLLAFGGVSRVFPYQALAVGEIAGPVILAYRRLSDCEEVEKSAYLLVAMQIALPIS